MATVASSPPPTPSLTPEQQIEADKLDEDIASVRAEIAALTKRQSLLSSTLLASTNAQSRLRQHFSSDQNLTHLLNQQSIQSQQSAYRLAFGITSFPFVDPSPDTSNVRLLGIRFDICKGNGGFEAPYYVLLKRSETNNGDGNEVGNEYKVHRHTIPALVAVEKHEARYLPASDEGYGSEDSMLGASEGKQDLMGFVTTIRNDLTSWRMRKEAIELCRKKLTEDDTLGTEIGEFKYGVQSVGAVAEDAYFVRVVWSNGKVGRVKIEADGTIQKAVVFMMVDGEHQRCPDVERALLGGPGRIENLVDRLREIFETVRHDETQR